MVNHGLVLQHVVDVLDFTQGLQDRVFDLEEFFLVGSVTLHDLGLLELELGVLDSHDLSQHLFLQSRRGDGEVDDRHFDRGFGGEDRVRDGGREVDSESLVIVEGLVSQSDSVPGAGLFDVLLENRF